MNPIKTTLHESGMAKEQEDDDESQGKICEYLIAELRNPFKEPKASELLDGIEWSNIDKTKAKVFTREYQHVFDLVHNEIIKFEQQRKLKIFA